MHVKKLSFAKSAVVLSVAALALSACGGSNNPAPNGTDGGGSGVSGTLTGGGSSAQETAMTAWIDGFKSVEAGATVQYNPVGSGSGREGFIAGQYMWAGSDAAMDDEEIASAAETCGSEGIVQLPAYISPIAVAYNLPGIDENIKMDAETIAHVFAGEITNWNDEAIASQNEGVELPDQTITVVHRSDDSGTTENFTEYLEAAAGDAWGEEADGAWPSAYQAENAQGNSGVVGLATQTEGSIVYAELSQIGSLGTVDVKVGDDYAAITPEAAAGAVENSPRVDEASSTNLAVEIDRTSTEAGTYPIVLVAYNIFCTTYKDQETADLVKSFASYIVSEDGQATAGDSAGSAPISAATGEQSQAAIDEITVAE
ncbi:phosphate ABC transporter substrate-binding protein PstS [Kocuria polaris]|nr:phosphate ABC transporter substrate-binding protein PstS [Kocuria polaris]